MGATRTQETKASTCKLAEPAGRPAFTTNEVPRGGETDLSRPTSGQAARGAGKPAWELILSSCPARQPRERLNTGESPADSCPSRMFSATWESNLSATHRRLTCACASTNKQACTESYVLYRPRPGRLPGSRIEDENENTILNEHRAEVRRRHSSCVA